MKFKNKFIVGTITLIALLMLSACSSSNKKIVTMKGASFTEADGYKDLTVGNPQASSAILQAVLNKIFLEEAGDKVKQSKIDAQLKKIKEQVKQQATASGNGGDFASLIKQAGYKDEKEFIDRYIKPQLAQEIVLEDNIKISEKEYKAAFKEYHPEVEAQIIKFDKEDEAKKILAEAKKPKADFTKLAKKNSTDVDTKSKGGKVKFDSTNTKIPKEVQTAAWKLKKNQISGVVSATEAASSQMAMMGASGTTSYYIIKMLKPKAKGNTWKPYKKILTKIITTEKKADQQFINEVYKKLMKKYNVKVEDQVLSEAFAQYGIGVTSTSSKAKSSSSSSKKKSSSSSKKKESSSSSAKKEESSSSKKEESSSSSSSTTTSTENNGNADNPNAESANDETKTSDTNANADNQNEESTNDETNDTEPNQTNGDEKQQ